MTKDKPAFDRVAWGKEYNSRPEVKEKRKLRDANPEVKRKKKISQKKYAEKNFHKVESARLLRKFGITFDDYLKLFNKQAGKCAICDVHQANLKTKLHVDHCHTSGKVRGLLCYNCNRGLGLFKDKASSLEKAARYVNEFDWD